MLDSGQKLSTQNEFSPLSGLSCLCPRTAAAATGGTRTRFCRTAAGFLFVVIVVIIVFFFSFDFPRRRFSLRFSSLYFRLPRFGVFLSCFYLSRAWRCSSLLLRCASCGGLSLYIALRFGTSRCGRRTGSYRCLRLHASAFCAALTFNSRRRCCRTSRSIRSSANIRSCSPPFHVAGTGTASRG